VTKARIVLDTNVLVSAIVFGGRPRIALEKVISGAVAMAISEEMLEELRWVLEGQKFCYLPPVVQIILNELLAIWSTPTRQITGSSSAPWKATLIALSQGINIFWNSVSSKASPFSPSATLSQSPEPVILAVSHGLFMCRMFSPYLRISQTSPVLRNQVHIWARTRVVEACIHGKISQVRQELDDGVSRDLKSED
jgi:hypothetical protein